MGQFLLLFILCLFCFKSFSDNTNSKPDKNNKYYPVKAVTADQDEHSIKYAQLISNLRNSKAANMREILVELDLLDKKYKDPQYVDNQCKMNSPYLKGFAAIRHFYKNAKERVTKWYKGYKKNNSVCAIKFLPKKRRPKRAKTALKREYTLKSFKGLEEAHKAGFMVTHHKECGACSSLEDLAVYLSVDLTEKARICSLKFSSKKIQKCYEEEIGFTPFCAQAWTFNSQHTKLKCTFRCIQDYGLFNILTRKFQKFPHVISTTDKDGKPIKKLRPCIECDEVRSGAGFKYGSGRTRRNSNIKSEIDRESGEIKPVDHYKYFNN